MTHLRYEDFVEDFTGRNMQRGQAENMFGSISLFFFFSISFFRLDLITRLIVTIRFLLIAREESQTQFCISESLILAQKKTKTWKKTSIIKSGKILFVHDIDITEANNAAWPRLEVGFARLKLCKHNRHSIKGWIIIERDKGRKKRVKNMPFPEKDRNFCLRLLGIRAKL